MGAFCTKLRIAISSFALSKLRTCSFVWHKNHLTKPTRWEFWSNVNSPKAYRAYGSYGRTERCVIRQTSSVAVRHATTAVGRRLASTYLVFLAGITRVAGVTGIAGEFERSLFSGRCEALRRREADEMVAHSNSFDGGLAVRLPDYLRKIATPHRTKKAIRSIA